MKIGCVGDLHLGAGSDYGRVPGERLSDQRETWKEICDLFVEHGVDVVLFAGDAWERRRPTPGELLAFKAGIDILLGRDVQVIVIPGNHDVEAFDRPTAYELFPDSDALFVYMTAPTTVRTFGAHGGEINVAGLPWTPVSNLVARNGGGNRDELNAIAAELLLDTARELRAGMGDDLPTILLLHWSVSGASVPSGIPTETLREPVLPLAELEQLGFDAIVCGHIHKAQLLATNPVEPDMPIFYTGSPMPLNFGESKLDHGVWILESHPIGTRGALSWTPTFVAIESRRFVTMDAGDVRGRGGALPWLWPDDLEVLRDSIVKVKYRATAEEARKIDHAQLRTFLYEEAGVHKVYAIEASIEREARARVEGLDEGITPGDALHAYAFANDIDDDTERAMLERTGRYLEAVGS